MARARVRINVSNETAKLRAIHAHAKGLAKSDGLAVKRQLRKGLKDAAKPVLAAQKTTVKSLTGAPSEWKAKAARRAGIAVKFGKKTASVTLRVSRYKDAGPYARYLNRGKWSHPTFGHKPWKSQQVTPGWFDKPAEASNRRFFKAVSRVIDDIINNFVKW